MKSTIDSAGRIVIPKSIRSQVGFTAGQAVEITFRDGAIMIEPALSDVTLVKRGRWLLAMAPEDAPPLTVEDVQSVLDQVRARS